MKKVFILTVILLSFILQSLSSDGELIFGVYPVFNSKTLIKLFQPVAESIERSAGISVRLVSAPDWETFNQRTLDGRYDLIWTNNALYFKASDLTGYYAIASGVPDLNGVVMVRDDSSIYSLKDLEGKKIVAIAEESFAGYLFFRTGMADLGLYSPDDFSVEFNEDIESLPFLVLNGFYDACVFSEQIYFDSTIYQNTNEKLRIIAYSIDIPRFPFAVKPGTDPELVKKIQTGIMTITSGTEKGRVVLEQLNLESFILRQDSDYAEFRSIYQKITDYKKPENYEKTD